MAADKKISELPFSNVIGGGLFAVEVPGRPRTNSTSVDVVAAIAAGLVQVGRPRSGNLTPLNGFGDDKDVYFKTNGEIYYKQGGIWGLVGVLDIPTTQSPQEQSVSGVSDPVQVPVPAGYSKYKVNVYIGNGQQDNSRIVIDPGGTVDNANVYINTFGETVLAVFF